MKSEGIEQDILMSDRTPGCRGRVRPDNACQMAGVLREDSAVSTQAACQKG